MARVKLLLASALLMMWLPATSFCQAENAGLITSGCCDESSSTDASPCCVFASAIYKHDDSNSVIGISAKQPLAIVSVDVDLVPRIFPTTADCESPPEIRSSWQFLARAAASPRAPSLAL